MSLPTRVLTNAGAPLYAPNGSLLTNTKISFTLVDSIGNPTDAFDVLTQSRVIGNILIGHVVAFTNAAGEFSITLWPNDRGDTVTQYMCSIAGAVNFLSQVPSGNAPLSWFDFKHEGKILTVEEVALLSAHIADTVLHLTPEQAAAISTIGDSDTYIRTTPTPTTIGGIVAGTTFNTTVTGVLDTLLYPYQYPAFTSFGFTQTSPLEVGTTLAGAIRAFSWTTSSTDNINAGSGTISDVTRATTLGTGLSLTNVPQSFAVATIINSTAATHTWRIDAFNTKDLLISRSFSISWQWRVTYGESTNITLTSAEILALRVTGLAASFSGTKSFLGGGYKWMCYPTSFGLKTSFKDTATNLEVAMVSAITVTVTNTLGIAQAYYAHRTLNILGGAINIAVA